MSGRTVYDVIFRELTRLGVAAPSSNAEVIANRLDVDDETDLDTHRLVAVSPDVARLIEAVGADNLQALLRVALLTRADWLGQSEPQMYAVKAVPAATWERLGEALEEG